MPLGYRIVSTSSEAESFPASNLQRVELYRPWLTNEPQSKHRQQAVVEVEFETPAIIKNIDLGNAGSAFVEIFVKHKDSDEYQVILPIASLMTFKESQTKMNRDRCKFFSTDKLSKTVVAEPWRKVKVVCTQPFVKDQQIGLSFLRFNVDKPFNPERGVSQFLDAQSEAGSKATPVSTRPASGNEPSNVPVTSAVSAVTGASPSILPQSSSKQPKEELPRKRIGDEKDESLHLTVPKNNASPANNAPNRTLSDDRSEETPARRVAPAVPPKKILSDVVFVISAYVNPARAQIREKAVELGAKYETQWTSACTHLISQYENTPKSQEAAETGGIVVTKAWIDECYTQQKRVPESEFGFAINKPTLAKAKHASVLLEDDSDSVPQQLSKKKKPAPKKKTSASDDEESDGPNEYDLNDSFIAKDDDYAAYLRKQAHGSDESDASGESSSDENIDQLVAEAKSFIRDETRWEKKLKNKRVAEAERMRQLEDEEAAKGKRARLASPPSAATSDAKAAALQDLVAMRSKPAKSPVPTSVAVDPGEHSDHTEELDASELAARQQLIRETDDAPPHDEPDLPDFFTGLQFCLHSDSIDEKEKRTLSRFITAYGGILHKSIDGSTTHVVTGGSWNDYFSTLQNDAPDLVFVKKAWVLACHRQQRLLSTSEYIVH